jgi:mannan endo-1,4-beta-mannosidase
VWKGYPRPPDGTYDYDGQINCDGSTSVTAPLANGGSASGIVGMSFHQPFPASSAKNYANTLAAAVPGGATAAWFSNVINKAGNTAEYQALIADLSYLADQLSYFAQYDVPVLLRPYHEMNHSSFWWGGQDTYSYQVLWQVMHDYLVNQRHLHNLIFVWAPASWNPTGTDVPWNYYPGAQYVDIVAVDYYNGSNANRLAASDATNLKTYYAALVNYGKPRMLAESYYVPVTSTVNALTASPWVIWNVWGDGLTSHNTNADVQTTYYRTSQIYTGGSGSGYGQNVSWGQLHQD